MVWKITTDELLARYNAGERDFAGVEILRIVGEIGERDGVDGQITGLEGAELRGINLRGANLEKLNLSGADLTEADLFGAYLGEAGLVKTILRNTNLFSANLTNARLQCADLTGADMRHVKAVDASFIGAKIGYLERADLTQANFQGAVGMLINGHFNVIWGTTMPDGSVETGPYCIWK